jgi:hypothetical protein
VANPALLALVDAALAERFDQNPARASVSFLGVDAIEVLRFDGAPGERIYVSLGMSSSPMTAADLDVLNADGPRAELLLHVRDELDRLGDVWRKLAVLAASPAVEGVAYRDGMTVDLGEPLAPGSACTGGLVMHSSIPTIETGEGSVEILRVVPALPNELAWARVRGGAALFERWEERATDLLDMTRTAVELG